MRLLCDRHHADLLYAMQRLFEDRLKIDVYIPTGREWWDEGIWQFGKSLGDDRLAAQYLHTHEGVYRPTTTKGLYTTYDEAHPDRYIRCITLEGFRNWEFDFVMPSVQENQKGYHTLAQETGARYLYQVGNTGQQIDWSLDPFVLSSSEAEIKGRGVVIHQEIDSGPGGAFEESMTPLATNTVRNFVNAMNRIPGYDEFLKVEEAMPDWEFTIHGHEGRDGDINPVQAVGDLMSSAGWGWHDKPVGDGFGHVIHAWAAIGRPVIGHASFYRGKMAEPFFHSSVCIDLDDVKVEDVPDELRMVTPGEHEDMCWEMRRIFDRLVDYEAEADSVRELLDLT